MAATRDNVSLLTAGDQVFARKRKRKEAASRRNGKGSVTEEVVFDDTARREYLTGFHKRKLARKEVAKKLALERERQERLEARKVAREARKEQAEENMRRERRALGLDEEEEERESEKDGEGKDGSGEIEGPAEEEYDTDEHVTTVTVVEDFIPGVFDEDLSSPSGSGWKAKKKGDMRVGSADGEEEGDLADEGDEGDETDDAPPKRKVAKLGSSSTTPQDSSRRRTALSSSASSAAKTNKPFRYESKAARMAGRRKVGEQRRKKAEERISASKAKGKGGGKRRR